MRTRHKPPALVSMWMLDVFCCALGCVTLLWLLNTREAGEQTRRAGTALETLARTEADLSAARADAVAAKAEFDRARRELNSDLDVLQAKFVAVSAERDDATKKLAAAATDLDDLRTKLDSATTRSRDLDDLLARKSKDAAALAAKLSESSTSADELARLVRQREKERDALALKAKAAEEQVNDLDARLKAAVREAKDAAAELAAMRKTGDELSASRASLQSTQKKLDEANATIIDLQGQKAKLADKVDRIRSDTDNRFAGIVLGGKRVVFAVDMSGSMTRLDPDTPAPAKWPAVAETVGKVMRSLPGLEKFQVVVFSRGARYLLSDGGWVDYRGEASVQEAVTALKAVTPDGDTNLYAGLDLAFRLRPDGLDTVYLFSDGLPTSGPGLTPEQDRTLDGADRSRVLAKHVREVLTGNWNKTGRSDRVKLHAVGFFFESPAVGAFLWALARDNDGSFVGMSRP